MFGKDNIRQVHHLLVREGRVGVFCKIGQIVDRIEDGVDWLGDVEVHVVDGVLFGANLLGSDLAVGRKEMGDDVPQVRGVLASRAIQESAKVDRIDGFNHLGD